MFKNKLYETYIHGTTFDISVTVHHIYNQLDANRKPTSTDTTINFLSNHPLEQKLAAYRFSINRMLSLPLSKTQQHKEWKNIKQTARNNNIPIHLLTKLRHSMQKKHNQPQPPTPSTQNNKKWVTFTHSSPQVRKITNLFKNTNVKVAFRSSHTIAQLIRPHNTTTHSPTPHDTSGVYSLTCNTCKLAYVGQTSRTLHLRYQEHTRYIKNNNPQSAYALHILHNRHEYGPMNETMTLLKPLRDTSLLMPYEQYYIHSLHKEGKLIPEQCRGDPNPLLLSAIDPSQPPS